MAFPGASSENKEEPVSGASEWSARRGGEARTSKRHLEGCPNECLAKEEREEMWLQLGNLNDHPEVQGEEGAELQSVSGDEEEPPPLPDPRVHRAECMEAQKKLARLFIRRQPHPS